MGQGARERVPDEVTQDPVRLTASGSAFLATGLGLGKLSAGARLASSGGRRGEKACSHGATTGRFGEGSDRAPSLRPSCGDLDIFPFGSKAPRRLSRRVNPGQPNHWGSAEGGHPSDGG